MVEREGEERGAAGLVGVSLRNDAMTRGINEGLVKVGGKTVNVWGWENSPARGGGGENGEI